MKKTNSKVKKKISKFLNDIAWFFQINNFDKVITYKKEDKDGLAAEFTFEEDYQRITLWIYPIFSTHPLKEQVKFLIHELCHSITAPSKKALYDFLDGRLITPNRIKRNQ